METEATAKPGRPARLNRAQVIDAAVALADEEGLEGLTMRSVAHRLAAEAMSLYRHVRNKEDLIDGMVDAVFAEIDLPMGGDWKAAMRMRALSARQALARHPWAIGLMESRVRPGPANLRHHDAVLGVLLGAGFSSTAATRIYNLVDSYTYGFALQERNLPVGTPDEMAATGEEILRQIPAAAYPHLSKVGRDLIESAFDYRAEFEFGLDLILDALAAVLSPSDAVAMPAEP